LSTGLILLLMVGLSEHDDFVIQLIPSLEKYPSLIQFSQTLFGKFLTAALFAPPLYFMGHQIWIIAPVLIFIFSVFQPKGLSFFFLVSGVFIFIFDSFFYFRSPWPPNKESHLLLFALEKIDGELMTSTKIFSIISSCLGLLLIFALFSLYKKWGRRKSVLFFLSLITIVFILITESLRPFPVFYILTLGALLVLFKCFWFLAYSMESGSSFWGAISPFWMHGLALKHAIPRGAHELGLIQAQTHDQYAFWQLKGIKLSYWCLLVWFLADRFSDFFWGAGGRLHELPFSSFHSYNQLSIPLWEKWFVVLTQPLVFLSKELLAESGLIVAYLRLMGFSAKRAVYKPYLATNFNDFFQRIYFYYNALLVRFFFFPFLSFFSKFKVHIKLNLFLSAFLTLTVGGFIANYIRETQYFVTMGPLGAFQISWSRMLYFAVIGIASGISMIWPKRRGKTSLPLHVLRLGVIYIIYALAIFLQGHFETDSFVDRVEFLFSLFRF